MCEPSETGRVCSGSGDLNGCKLCPDSPTYWRKHATPPVADPWKGDRQSQAARVPMVDHGVVLEWGSKAAVRASTGPPRPCALCGKPTTLISPPTARWPQGRNIHKSCAEDVLTKQRRTESPDDAGKHAPDTL